jgi:N-acetylmuramoyl-L-alanine amidase
MRKINEIIVHCTATRPSWWADRLTQDKVDEVRRWHVEERGWKDVGYHWLIDRDGTVINGRDESVTGAHVRGRNANSIGISLFGGHGSSKDDTFEEHFTPEQDAALRQLIAEIEQRHAITKVSGHSEYANKACPGFNVSSWIAHKPAPAPRTSVTQSTTVQASAVQIASGAGAAVSSLAMLDGTAQLLAMAFGGLVILMGLWIMRERIKHWANGVR